MQSPNGGTEGIAVHGEVFQKKHTILVNRLSDYRNAGDAIAAGAER
jgi:hypothetical protein